MMEMTQREQLDALKSERIMVIAEMDTLEAKRLNDDLDITVEEMDRLRELRDRKAAIATKSIQLQIALRTPRQTPRAQVLGRRRPRGRRLRIGGYRRAYTQSRQSGTASCDHVERWACLRGLL